MTVGAIDPGQTLGELVTARPMLAQALERLRLDYCCGGSQTLAAACRARDLDPQTVAIALTALGDVPESAFTSHDLRGATIPDLCDHVVSAHHDRLRDELPRLAELLATVVRVHGQEHAELHDLHRLYAGLERELLEHIESEEATIFPAARAAAAGGAIDPRLAELVDEHVREHVNAGDSLAALRELAGGYDTGRAYCGTHRSLLEQLEAFERDLHQHIHEENNILFPQLSAAAAA